jgi:radical SAM superfamily enzyme YgiQ (UPF0313 family)
MNFLLLHVPSGFELPSDTKKTQIPRSYHPPLGLLYIGRVLEDEGHKVEILDLLAEELPIEALKKSLTTADAVGMSVYSSSYQESLRGIIYTQAYKESAKVAKLIKEIDSTIPIIIGGPHCSSVPKKSLAEIPAADISVEGDGEQVIKDIINTFEGTKKLSELPGVHYREHGEIKTGKPPKIIENIDSLPFPARHLVDKYDYGEKNRSYIFKPKFTSIIMARGCQFNCRFCSRNALGFKTYRTRSVENIVKEIQEIDEKYSSVMIVDDNFLSDKKRSSEVMDRLIELGTDVNIYIQGARVDTAERELYKKMKKANVKQLYFGIESGNQDVLYFYNKKTTLDQIRRAVNLSREMDFFTSGSFILGAPFETKEHIERTIKFACSLPLDTAIFTILTYKYGSDLWDEAVKNGKISENDGYAVLADSRKGLGNFTTEELEDFYRKAVTRFYLRPSHITRQIIRSINGKIST